MLESFYFMKFGKFIIFSYLLYVFRSQSISLMTRHEQEIRCMHNETRHKREESESVLKDVDNPLQLRENNLKSKKGSK